MKRIRRAYRPSKICPHRWCGAVHALIGLFFLVQLMILIRSDVAYAAKVFLVCAAVEAPLVVWMVRSPKAMRTATKAVQGLDAATVPNARLRVDASWARAAVMLDVLNMMLLPIGIMQIVHHRPGSFWEGVLGNFLFGAQVYVHWRATHRPRRRVRADAAVAVASQA